MNFGTALEGGNMFCSGCGQALNPGQTVCPQCKRPVAPLAPPVPGFEYVPFSDQDLYGPVNELWG